MALARYSGKPVIVTNNLLDAGAATQLRHPLVAAKYIQVVRDGRAVAASYKRKFAEKNFLQAITGFLQPSFRNFVFDEANPDLLCIRHEDALASQEGMLERAGRYLGLNYDPSALKFWTWRHHLVHGNPGFIATLRLGEGLPAADFESSEFYRRQFERISGGEPALFQDDRAGEILTRFDRFVFDRFAGEDNARFGYERDTFSDGEARRFGELTNFAIRAGLVPKAMVSRFMSFEGAA